MSDPAPPSDRPAGGDGGASDPADPFRAEPLGPANPWPGLTTFAEADRDFFFGREEEVAELLRLVRRDLLTVLLRPVRSRQELAPLRRRVPQSARGERAADLPAHRPRRGIGPSGGAGHRGDPPRGGAGRRRGARRRRGRDAVGVLPSRRRGVLEPAARRGHTGPGLRPVRGAVHARHAAPPSARRARARCWTSWAI